MGAGAEVVRMNRHWPTFHDGGMPPGCSEAKVGRELQPCEPWQRAESICWACRGGQWYRCEVCKRTGFIMQPKEKRVE